MATEVNELAQSRDGEGLEVLYVEDSALVAKRTREELLGLGYDCVDHCKTWASAEEKLRERGSTYDAAILDIELDGSALDGIDVAGLLYARYNMPVVIVTNFSDERTQLRLEAIPSAGYLLKPATGKQIDAAVRRRMSLTGKLQGHILTASGTTGKRLAEARLDAPLVNFRAAYAEKFPFEHLLYVEADGGQVLLHTIDGKVRPFSMGMDKTLKFFNRDDLIRVHKSYAVRFDAIKKCAHYYVELIDGTQVRVGNKYRAELGA